MDTSFNNFNQDCEALLVQAGRGDRTLVVGVSGGLDSIVLLDLLSKFISKQHLALVVAHVHHGLRREADDDALFVEEQATRRGWPFRFAHVPVKEHAERYGVSLEMAGRTLRHKALAAISAEAGTRTLVLAHHADDQIETLFLRLLRGAAPGSWGGMRPFGPSPADPALTILRPLLGHLREDLAAYAAINALPFREDASNQDLTIPRNLIRQQIIPMLGSVRKGADWKRSLLRSMAVAREESALLEKLASEAAGAVGQSGFPRMMEMEPALIRRWIVRELWRLGVPPDSQLIDRLCQSPADWVQVNQATQVSLTPDGTLRTRAVPGGGRLNPTAAPGAEVPPLDIQLGSDVGSRGSFKWGGLAVDWELGPRQLAWGCGVSHPPPDGVEAFDSEAVGSGIVLRSWLPGDRFQPLGSPGSSKVQDLFVNAKVPREERARRCVAFSLTANRIFWIEGLRVGEGFQVREDSARRALLWSWRRA